MRRPRQLEAFHVEEPVRTAGLSTVLTGTLPLEEALVYPTIDGTGLETLRKIEGSGEQPQLALLGSGPAPANPQAVLGAERTRELIDRLASNCDLLLIDSPPVLAVSDALSLLPLVDGVIIVARIGSVSAHTTQRLMDTLGRVAGPKALGVVVNDLSSGALADEYGEAYGYDPQPGRVAGVSNGSAAVGSKDDRPAQSSKT
jgi:Mrp family chromosome partitioning ATPase